MGWLTRHGVTAYLQRDSAADLRETVPGGASRVLLGNMTAPLVIAHRGARLRKVTL